MREKKILLASPHMSRQGWERYYVKKAFDENWVAPVGENIDALEVELAEMVTSPHAVALSSGTSAIHLGLKTLGVKKGDYVICSTFTFAGSANPICYEGAQPIFVESEKETWNMDPKALEEALSRYPQTKAVIVVHLYGIPAKMQEIQEICSRFNVPILEDAAESLGSYYKGQMTGTFGDVGIYSFNGNKIITTSGGGALVTARREIAEKVKFLSTQAKEPVDFYEHKEIGYNYRMSNISAGIGRGQLKVLKHRVEKKKYLHTTYQKELQGISELSFMPTPKDTDCNYWLNCVTFKKTDPKKVMAALQEEKIESRLLWKPMHQQPVFANSLYFGKGYSEKLFQQGLCLPSDTKMRETDLERVIHQLKKILKQEATGEESYENSTSGYHFGYT